MKIEIDGKSYSTDLQPFIGDLRRLKAEFGFGYGEVARRLSSLDEDSDMLTLIDDDKFLDALIAWVWMARLRAGERDVTKQDVEMLCIDDIKFVPEPGDEVKEDENPTSAQTGSVLGEEPVSPAVAV